MRISSEQRHLTLCIAPIGTMGVGLYEFSDSEAIRRSFRGDRSVFAHQSSPCSILFRRCKRLVENSAGFEKRLHPVPTIFAADAGVFESSPGCLRIIRHVVDHHSPGPYLRSHSTRALKVGPEDGGVEAIFRVVGDPDRLVLGVVSDDGQYRAEDLLLGDRHVVLHVDKNRGFHEVTRLEAFRMTLAADEDLSAFLDALADIRLYAFVLFL